MLQIPFFFRLQLTITVIRLSGTATQKRTVKFYEGRKLILLVQIIRCTVIHEDQTEVVKSNIFIYDIRFTWAVIILLVCTYSAVTNIRIFPYVYMITLLCFTLPWHPLSRAPSYFKPNIPLAILDDHEVKYHGKLVVATDDFVRPNIIAATGLPVLNNTSHYTDKSIFDEFYKNESNSSDYNRFHHMHIKITGSGDPKLEIPYGDVIRLSIPGNTFDFTRLHSDFLMTYAGNE